tara:strand:- start:104 stop:229 length:126 start_codon:yes stop_codon:yes gene_type:complete
MLKTDMVDAMLANDSTEPTEKRESTEAGAARQNTAYALNSE